MQGNIGTPFRGLRTVLELTVQTVYLSAHTLDLHDSGLEEGYGLDRIDWRGGIFLPAIYVCVFSELESSRSNFRAMASKLYRECSEAVHGNMPKFIAAPAELQFSEDAFKLWHDKADLVALVSTFCLAMRYALDADLSKLEPALRHRLGHLQPSDN